MRSKPSPLIRLIHDLYAGFPAPVLPLLRFIDDPALVPAEEKVQLQTAGVAKLPHHLEAVYYGADYATTSIHWPAVFSFRLRDAHIAGDQGQVYLSDGRLLAVGQDTRSQLPLKIRRPIRWLARKAGTPLFHLTGRNHENHGHFVVEHLPRYFAAREWLERFDGKILLAPTHLRWQARYLKLLGVEESRLVEGTPGTLSAEELLLVPSLGGNTPFCNPELFRSMTAAMQQNIRRSGWYEPDALTPNGAAALWISRRDAPDRQLVNEEALVAAARKIIGHVEVVKLSQLSFEQQVRKLNQSWCIIGAQGQGLTNALFASGKLVVIMEQGDCNQGHNWAAFFRDMAEFAGNQAVRLFSGTGSNAARNWVYPEEKFSAELRRLLEVAKPAFQASVAFP